MFHTFSSFAVPSLAACFSFRSANRLPIQAYSLCETLEKEVGFGENLNSPMTLIIGVMDDTSEGYHDFQFAFIEDMGDPDVMPFPCGAANLKELLQGKGMMFDVVVPGLKEDYPVTVNLDALFLAFNPVSLMDIANAIFEIAEVENDGHAAYSEAKAEEFLFIDLTAALYMALTLKH